MSLGSFLGGLNLLTLLAAAHHPDSIHCSLVSHLSQAVTSVALTFLTALTISPSFPDLRYIFALHSGTGSGSVSHSIFFFAQTALHANVCCSESCKNSGFCHTINTETPLSLFSDTPLLPRVTEVPQLLFCRTGFFTHSRMKEMSGWTD